MKNLGILKGTTGASSTNRIQNMEERLTGITEDINISVKENVKTESPDTIHPRNLGHHDKTNLRIIRI